MSKKFIIVVINLLLAVTVWLSACSVPADNTGPGLNGDPSENKTSTMDGYVSRYHPAHISAGEAWEMMAADSGAVMLDVRSEASYNERHVSIAASVPYETIEDYAAANLPDKDQIIICYCFCGDMGGPALSAYNLLTGLGYTNVFYTDPESEWTYEGTAVTEAETEDNGHKIITGDEAKGICDSDSTATLLDVRNQDEYDAGHISGSVLIPVAELESRLSELPPERDAVIIVYCRAGVRSATAYNILSEAGYTDIYDMQKAENWPEPLIAGLN